MWSSLFCIRDTFRYSLATFAKTVKKQKKKNEYSNKTVLNMNKLNKYALTNAYIAKSYAGSSQPTCPRLSLCTLKDNSRVFIRLATDWKRIVEWRFSGSSKASGQKVLILCQMLPCNLLFGLSYVFGLITISGKFRKLNAKNREVVVNFIAVVRG